MAGFDQLEGEIWIDGKFVDWTDAKVHFLTHGLHYASSVFEGVRAYDGSIFKLPEHNARLIASAKMLDMDTPYTVEQLNDLTYDVLERNTLKDAYIRPLIWRGSEQMAISSKGATIHIAIAAWGGLSFSDKDRTTGLRLKTVKWKRPSPETAPVQAKAAGLYMISTLSKHEAEREGYDDALLHDYRGNVAEASGANIFFVKDGEIHTPIPDCFLNGITRQTAIEMAADKGMKMHVRHIHPDELSDMDECFITGTAAEVRVVESIDDIVYGVGDISMDFVTSYQDLVHTPAPEKLARAKRQNK